jgi:hypothetical protein
MTKRGGVASPPQHGYNCVCAFRPKASCALGKAAKRPLFVVWLDEDRGWGRRVSTLTTEEWERLLESTRLRAECLGSLLQTESLILAQG